MRHFVSYHCSRSPQWEGVTEERKEELGVVKRDDGEFWMSFQDFLDIWKTLEICHLEPSVGEVEPELVGCKKWNSTERHGKWQRGMTAGGCANYRTSTFCSNPQYIVQVEDPDDEDDDDTCTVVFSLIQKDRRKQKHLGKANLAVGFYIYETAPNQKKLKKRDVCTRRPAATSGSYINLREVTKRVKLPPGNYIVMPSTFKPNEEADFLLRIYTEKPSTTEDAEPEQVIRREQTVEVKKGRRVSRQTVMYIRTDQTETGRPLVVVGNTKGIVTLPEPWELVPKVAWATGVFSEIWRGKEPTPTLVGEKEDRVRKAFEVIASMGGDEEATFNKSDANKNGKLESYELREALRDVCGVTIDGQLAAKIIRRYADQDNTISAASFWRIAIRLKAFFDVYLSK
uniref:EF-hand domain-containing protein n=1 Tax=Branchiostoma floridae TaxID=7739 RepID=C3Y6N9_BRAFL|eukprot:XP_002607989.1 hypothetical protein BRAFLDRAFT_74938 [Branchiostoma floridae]